MSGEAFDLGGAIGTIRLSDFTDIAKEEAKAAQAEFTDEERAAIERAGRDYLKLLGQAIKGKADDPAKAAAWQREMDHLDLQVAAWAFKGAGVARRAFWRAAERMAKRAGELALQVAIAAGKLALKAAL